MGQGGAYYNALRGTDSKLQKRVIQFSLQPTDTHPPNVSSSYHYVVEIWVIFTFPLLLIWICASGLSEISLSSFRYKENH